MLWIPAGFDFGTTITSVLRVKLTGLSTKPCGNSSAGMSVFAEAKTSAGAPFRICVASAFEPANEYVCVLSIAGKTSVSDAAANTVTDTVALVDFAAAPPLTSPAQRTTMASSATARVLERDSLTRTPFFERVVDTAPITR